MTPVNSPNLLAFYILLFAAVIAITTASYVVAAWLENRKLVRSLRDGMAQQKADLQTLNNRLEDKNERLKNDMKSFLADDVATARWVSNHGVVYLLKEVAECISRTKPIEERLLTGLKKAIKDYETRK